MWCNLGQLKAEQRKRNRDELETKSQLTKKLKSMMWLVNYEFVLNIKGQLWKLGSLLNGWNTITKMYSTIPLLRWNRCTHKELDFLCFRHFTKYAFQNKHEFYMQITAFQRLSNWCWKREISGSSLWRDAWNSESVATSLQNSFEPYLSAWKYIGISSGINLVL